MNEDALPLLTVCMPTKNSAWCLDRVLRAIESVDYPRDRIKLVFVDDFSEDGTFEKLLEWRDRMKGQYYDIVVVQKRTNIPQARNLCVKYAEGEYILFWDSDVVPPKILLKEMVSIMESDDSIGIIGADYIYEQHVKVKYKPTTDKETHAVYMGFTLIRRNIIDLVGGFNESLSVGEDTEFCIRVRERTKYKILWASKPVLHLKRVEDLRKKTLLAWIKYNYSVRAKQYYKTFKNLPTYLKIRIFYYLGLPLIVAFCISVSITIDPGFSLLGFIYLAPSLYLVVKQKGLREGFRIWLKFNVPTGLALSYGVLKEFLYDIARARLKAS